MAVDPEWIEDLFSPFGQVRLKRMFSGYGVYAGDFCIALALSAGVCLRCTPGSQVRYREIGATPFTYTARGKLVTVNAWWLMPADMLDDPDALAGWARHSLEIARALPPKNKKPGRKAVSAPEI